MLQTRRRPVFSLSELLTRSIADDLSSDSLRLLVLRDRAGNSARDNIRSVHAALWCAGSRESGRSS